MFAAVHFDKLKTVTHLSKADFHNRRLSAVPNADPERTTLNKVLIESPSAWDAWHAMVGDQTVRKNAVLAVQATLIRSKDWTGDEEEWLRRSMEWAEKRFGRANIISAVAHYDETTPHVHVLFTPLVAGKLNCRALLGGARKLAEFQTSYAEAMAPLGLSRGKFHSQAEHGDIHEFYKLINEAQRTEPPAPKKGILGGISGADGDKLHHAARAAHAFAHKADMARKAAEARAEAAEAKLAKADEKLTHLKAQAERLRTIPLGKVCEKLGAANDKTDPLKWWLPNGERIVIGQDGRFHVVSASGGGRGAFDLVMRALKCDFKGAGSWLAEAFGMESTAAEYRCSDALPKAVATWAALPVPSPVPTAIPENWPPVRDYLISIQKLSAEVVDKLKASGRIFADVRRNAVFRHATLEGLLAGWEILGTVGKAFKGARGEMVGFLVDNCAVTKPTPGLVLCESAIDAISCTQKTGKTAVSLGGSNMTAAMKWAEIGKQLHGPVFAGFDSAADGAAMADALIRSCPWVTRLSALGKVKDWIRIFEMEDPQIKKPRKLIKKPTVPSRRTF